MVDVAFVEVEIKVSNNRSKVVGAVLVAEHLEVEMLEKNKLHMREKVKAILIKVTTLLITDQLMEEADLEVVGVDVKDKEEVFFN